MTQIFTFEERIDYLRQYGTHCMAYHTLQPGLSYYDLPGAGYLAYMQHGGTRFFLADPIAAKDQTRRLVAEALREHPDVCFAQVQKETAELLREFGLHAIQMGIETRIELSTWTPSGRKKEGIRIARNKARKMGVEIRESDPGESSGAVIQALSDAWLSTRKVAHREIIFLDRPFSPVPEPGVRRFFAYLDGRPIGVADCDPIHENGRVTGYMPSVRASKEFPKGLYYLFLAHLADLFRGGVKWIYLGASPLSTRVRAPIGGAKAFESILRLIHRYGTPLYNFRGIEFTKSVFCGEEAPVYACTRSAFPLLTALRLFRVCRVL